MDELDLELVARLRAEPAPDHDTVTRHRRQLEAAIQAAVADPAPTGAAAVGRAAATVVDGGTDDEVDATPAVPLARRPGGTARRPSRRRIVALAAATVAVLGGLFAASRVTSDPGGGTSTATQPPVAAGCGMELPFTFPAPAGFEGPFPGPSEGAPPLQDLSPDTLLVHWRSADAAIDLRWPSYPPLDPTTPVPEGATDLSEYPLEPQPMAGGRWAATAVAYSLVIGTGECSGFDVVASAGSAEASATVLDQVEMALAGPGGPLAPERPALVTGTTSADALPPLPESDVCEEPNRSGSVDGAGSYATPREALAFYLAAEPKHPNGGYQEITLPDGSFGYAFRPELADGSPAPASTDPTVVLHVAPRGDGWAVASFDHTSC